MGRQRRLAWLALAACVLAAAPAGAADRWEEAAGGAVAILPVPSEAKGIAGGSLYCAEQKWSFLFRVENSVGLGGAARMVLDGEEFALDAAPVSGGLNVPVPTEILDPLRTGTSMSFETGFDDTAVQAVFNLRGSGKVIEAIAPRCSPVDMSAYEAVTLLDAGPAVDMATTLFEDEAKLFRSATGRNPVVTARQLDLADGKRLLFGALCGSTSYYGTSGCTLWGWASMSAAADWQPVYSTEGQKLYLDQNGAKDGWPALATLPMVNGSDINHWLWSGSAYELEGMHVAADDEGATVDAAQ